jgi:hypothetical protein
MSLLLYGITSVDVPLPEALLGVADAAVRRVVVGPVAMWVSDYAGLEVSPRRKNLSGFQNVLKSISGEYDLLPAAFGMLSADESEVSDLLERHCAALLAELERIRGACEYSFRLRFVGENLFADYIERFSELKALRDRAFLGGKAPNQNERIQLGQSFEKRLQSERVRILELLLSELKPCIKESLELNFENELVLCNIALLVDRAQVLILDAAVQSFADKFDDKHLVELLGPWPPYSFAELRLD